MVGATPQPGELRGNWSNTFRELSRLRDAGLHQAVSDPDFFVQLARASYHTKRLHDGIDALKRAIALATSEGAIRRQAPSRDTGFDPHAEALEYTSMMCDLFYHLSRQNATALGDVVTCLQRQFRLDEASRTPRLRWDSNFWKSYSSVLTELGRWNVGIAAMERSVRLGTEQAWATADDGNNSHIMNDGVPTTTANFTNDHDNSDESVCVGAVRRVIKVVVAEALDFLRAEEKREAEGGGRHRPYHALLEAVAARAEKAAVSKMRPLLVEWRGAQRLAKSFLMAHRYAETLDILHSGTRAHPFVVESGALGRSEPRDKERGNFRGRGAEAGGGGEGASGGAAGQQRKLISLLADRTLLDEWREVAELSPQGFVGMGHGYDAQAEMAIAAARRRREIYEAPPPPPLLSLLSSSSLSSWSSSLSQPREQREGSSREWELRKRGTTALSNGVKNMDRRRGGVRSAIAEEFLFVEVRNALVKALASEDLLWIADAWHDAGLAHMRLERHDEALYCVQVGNDTSLSQATTPGFNLTSL